ncbi:PAS domain-containing sensor histidine kinase [bacterium]|nr:PAS domain-containing sensor histidine kinase [bacterium]
MDTTLFAPAEVYGDAELRRQRELIRSVPMLEVLLNSVHVSVLVLNNLRQIVYCNKVFYDLVHALGTEEVYGKRPGEVFRCIHANELPSGCGTTEFCRTCGAVKAILDSQKGHSRQEECRIMTQKDVEVNALDVRVWSTPFEYQDISFTILSLIDISNEKRRAALEHIFFHDILNSATSVLGYASMMRYDEEADPENLGVLEDSVSMLIDDIAAQRDLKYAEQGELQVDVKLHNSGTIMDGVFARFRHQFNAEGRELLLDSKIDRVEFETDFGLLNRVLGNMVKNAFEATSKGQAVRVGCHKYRNHLEFWVNNPKPIPRNHQLQVFNRSFSTKGQGRGLGTYSMRLLTENYLNGRLSFTSSKEAGTTFSAYLPLQASDRNDRWRDGIPTYPISQAG